MNEETPRNCLPVTQPEKISSNLWSFLKNCIGKELTKITMPVQWNEPISLLQRLSENTHYIDLLKTASCQSDEDKRIMFVAAFAVSSLACNHERMGKPFNPLLGETFEFENRDYKVLSEQVCHHPPVSAFHAESQQGDYVFKGSMYPKVKFWGKSIEFQPKGTNTVELPKLDEIYTWNSVNCVVHNIIVGSIWMEQTGVMEITNHSSHHRCVLSFKPGGWFADKNDLNIVEGFIIDRNKNKTQFLYGKWSEFLCAVEIPSCETFFDIKAEKIYENASNLPKHCPLAINSIPGSKLLWQSNEKSENSELYYNFSQLTMSLNELKPYLDKIICPTDSRKRPDIRALEEGDLYKASQEKERLENKQREYRKPFKGKKERDWWKPMWFKQTTNKYTNEEDWTYTGNYWDRKNFENSPDIY